ncbi:hypothetical protein E2C01_035336 [Portunus trituberculatus]|uniref:Uncharacterized protein n=1 Tax=Portunus trituberculatus TaxID=210409 RepID=A0A5B7FB72_PORTR|nr:hypothetical protein [Portunus trituberculatus]
MVALEGATNRAPPNNEVLVRLGDSQSRGPHLYNPLSSPVVRSQGREEVSGAVVCLKELYMGRSSVSLYR